MFLGITFCDALKYDAETIDAMLTEAKRIWKVNRNVRECSPVTQRRYDGKIMSDLAVHLTKIPPGLWAFWLTLN